MARADRYHPKDENKEDRALEEKEYILTEMDSEEKISLTRLEAILTYDEVP